MRLFVLVSLWGNRMDLSLVGRRSLTVSKSVLKAPIVSDLKPDYDVTLSSFAFKFNLRRYSLWPAAGAGAGGAAGQGGAG